VIYSGGLIDFATSRSKGQIKADMESLKALLQSNFIDDDEYAIRFKELEDLHAFAPSDRQPQQSSSSARWLLFLLFFLVTFPLFFLRSFIAAFLRSFFLSCVAFIDSFI